MENLRNPLLDMEIRLEEKRVLMLAGSDLDFPSPALGSAPHRLLICEDAPPKSWQQENMVGWHIRRLAIEPRWRFVVSDDSAILTELDEAYNFKGLYSARGEAVEPIVKYFDELWESATDYVPSGLEMVEVRRAGHIAVLRKGDPYMDDRIQQFARNPQDLRTLEPNDFEQLIAELLRRDGMNVQLTGRGRDGGRDVLTWPSSAPSRALWLVECKRYAAPRKVDVRLVRALYGVLEAERATMGMLVTTSDFTRPAREFERGVSNRLVLRNFGEVAKWLKRLAER